jgi:hypothetical protein
MVRKAQLAEPDVTAEQLMQAAEEVVRSGHRRVVRVGGREIALVPHTRRPRSRPKVFTKDDPLWEIVGMLKADGGPTDVSENVDKYLAEAYLDTHE